jgi:hypothetical protein
VVLVGVMALLSIGAARPAGASERHVLAEWRMNEAPGATRLVDAGPHGIHGRIGADVQRGVVHGGALAHRFSFVLPDQEPVNPERLDTVPHDRRLDPQSDTYSVTVRLRTTSQLGGNVVQKGQAAAGQYWKLEIEDRIAYCLFRGSEGSRGAYALHPIDDGSWYTVRCERTPTGVAMWINGVLQSRSSGRTGDIANDWPVSIGGKTHCNQRSEDCDYFSGDIDVVKVETDRVVK